MSDVWEKSGQVQARDKLRIGCFRSVSMRLAASHQELLGTAEALLVRGESSGHSTRSIRTEGKATWAI